MIAIHKNKKPYLEEEKQFEDSDLPPSDHLSPHDFVDAMKGELAKELFEFGLDPKLIETVLFHMCGLTTPDEVYTSFKSGKRPSDLFPEETY